jgi:hypothetical protein
MPGLTRGSGVAHPGGSIIETLSPKVPSGAEVNWLRARDEHLDDLESKRLHLGRREIDRDDFQTVVFKQSDTVVDVILHVGELVSRCDVGGFYPPVWTEERIESRQHGWGRVEETVVFHLEDFTR